jgi:hypothetical protein
MHELVVISRCGVRGTRISSLDGRVKSSLVLDIHFLRQLLPSHRPACGVRWPFLDFSSKPSSYKLQSTKRLLPEFLASHGRPGCLKITFPAESIEVAKETSVLSTSLRHLHSSKKSLHLLGSHGRLAWGVAARHIVQRV